MASEKLTEFAVSTSISVPSLSLNFTEVFDGYPTVNTTSPANPPTYLAPIALSSTTITAAKTNQTITFTSTAPTNATVGGASYTPTATASSGLAVTFTIDASSTAGACSIAAGVVSFTGAGSCIIDANQAGNGTYNAAPQVQQTVTVGKGSQTVSFTSTAPSSGTVGGATYTPTATASSGLTPAITLDASSTGCTLAAGVVTFTAGGTCVIDANQAGNTNYNAAPQVQQSITVNKASQTVSFTSTAPAATVGGATYTPTATATSGLTPAITVDASSSTICTITGGVVSFIAAGTCTLDANQAGNGSYNAAAQVQQAVTVSKGNQTLTFTSTAPTATVGGASYTPTATSSAGLTVALTLDATSTGCSLTSGVVTFTAVGTCVIDANQAGNANYNPATQVKQSFAVGKGSQTVSFTSTAPAATVGGATYTPTATATSGLTPAITVDASSTTICSITAGVVSFTAAGSCVLDANQAGNANYNAATQVQQTVTVSKGNQTVSFTSTAPAGAVVGGATYTPTATATSGLTPAITVDASSTTICSITAGVVSFTAAGTCVLDANQAGNANYNAATQVQQTVTVGKGNQTVSFTSTAPARPPSAAPPTPRRPPPPRASPRPSPSTPRRARSAPSPGAWSPSSPTARASSTPTRPATPTTTPPRRSSSRSASARRPRPSPSPPRPRPGPPSGAPPTPRRPPPPRAWPSP